MRRLGAAGTLVVLALAACEAEAPKAAVPEQPAADALSQEVAQALEALARARESLTKGGEPPLEAISTAQTAIGRLERYYVPLLRAQQAVFDAVRLDAAGQSSQCSAELDHVEDILLGMAARADASTARAVRHPLELLEDGRLALADGDPAGSERLADLAEALDLMIWKGPMILP